MELCKPSLAIALISTAGVIYHLLSWDMRGLMWWAGVGILGTGTFQVLCFGGLETLAWVLMLIPVMVVCFFFAVALLSSQMRIRNFMKLPCREDRCNDHETEHNHHETRHERQIDHETEHNYHETEREFRKAGECHHRDRDRDHMYPRKCDQCSR